MLHAVLLGGFLYVADNVENYSKLVHLLLLEQNLAGTLDHVWQDAVKLILGSAHVARLGMHAMKMDCVESALGADTGVLTVPEELEVIKQLAALPEEIRLAARDYDPSRVNRFATELAARFHRFYTVCRIRDAEEGILEARLLLCSAVRQVLEIALGIIGVTAPEHM